MSFLDGRDVRKALASHPDTSRIVEAYRLSCLVHTATYPRDHVVDPIWASIVIPTPAGQELLDRVSTAPVSRQDARLALFGLHWFQDLLIDAQHSDLEAIRATIERGAKNNQLWWPSFHGRELYDRYLAMFPETRDELRPDEVAALLADMPQGVYQVGTLVTGPLGIIDGRWARFFPPSQSLGLWHCPMLDCRALHPVALQAPHGPLIEAYRLLVNEARRLWTTESIWHSALAYWPYAESDGWKARSGMPVFLGDCVVMGDRTQLVAAALRSPGGEFLRGLIRERRPRSSGGSPEEVASSLSAGEQLQVLLCLADDDIQELLDGLVASSHLVVPAGEVRRVDATKVKIHGASFSGRFELSGLGMRYGRHHPVLRLRRLLLSAYSQAGLLTDLDWRIQKQPGVSTDEALIQYLRRTSPSSALNALVLTSPTITKHLADALGASVDAPSDQSRRVLEWKLGFDLPREEDKLAAVRRLVHDSQAVISRVGVPRGDTDREAIRSATVNVFVELEGVIDEMIAFIVWLLSTDHPRVSLYIYSRARAMASVSIALGSELSAGGDVSRWSKNGNALGTCMRYLQRLHEWLRTLSVAERQVLVRPDDQVHPRAGDSALYFPFRHVQLWADAAPDGLADLSQQVMSCTDCLNRAELAEVRNGLEHYREANRFPSTGRILSALDLIMEFVEVADERRLVPKLWWFQGYSEDAFEQGTTRVVDYRSRVLEMHSPRTIVGCPGIARHSFSRPVVIAPGNLIGLPNAEIVLRVTPDSEYARYWDGYPARRGESPLGQQGESGEPQTPG